LSEILMQSRAYRRPTRKVLPISATQPQLVLSAMNIVAQHEAGVEVSAVRLKGARDYLELFARVAKTGQTNAAATLPARVLPETKEAA
jgi:hypothetical protein